MNSNDFEEYIIKIADNIILLVETPFVNYNNIRIKNIDPEYLKKNLKNINNNLNDAGTIILNQNYKILILYQGIYIITWIETNNKITTIHNKIIIFKNDAINFYNNI